MFLGLCNASHAQYAWGKVDPDQFSVKTCPFDTTANAMVLLDSEYVTVGIMGETYEVFRRVQIFNKEGFSYGTVKIPYFSYLNVQTFSKLEAQTINKDEKGAIHITKLKDNAIFDEDLSDYMSEKKFAFPDVSDGSILEYHYIVFSKSIGAIADWYFQHDIPTLRSAIFLKVYDWVHYTPTPRGDVLMSEYKSEPFDDGFSGKGMTRHYVMKNVPALKDEAYVTTMNDYRARMTFPLYSITIPNQKVRTFGESWDHVAQEMMDNQNFGSHLNEMLGEHINAAKDIARNQPDANAKIKAIYDNLSSKVKWDGKTRAYTTRRLSKTYTDGSGSSAELNLLLISMLRAAGIKADPVLVSTRGHGMIERAYPTTVQFNNVIALAEIDTSFILLDAASSFKPYNLVSFEDLNYQGLRICHNSGDPESVYKSKWIDIAPAKNSVSSLLATIVIDSTGSYHAKAALSASDYPAMKYRTQLEKETVKDCLKNAVKLEQDVDMTNESAENEKEIDKRLKLSFELAKTDSNAGSKMAYINPFPAKFMTDNPFKLAKRTYPVDYGYPFQQNIISSITVPANYKVSELPKQVNLKLEDGSASFIFRVAQTDNNIQINTSLKINSSQFQPGMYEDLKTLYAKMIDAYNSTIVLEKIN